MQISGFNALSGLYLISTVPLQKPRFYAVSRACFCRYLSEYSDNSRFSCMLTFWTYLMRCTYPWHWIKYSPKYNRCHPIFSLSWQVELSSNTLSSRAAAQTPLHKMYTFVYRTFIKFILFCRGQALDVPLCRSISCSQNKNSSKYIWIHYYKSSVFIWYKRY